MFRDDVSVGQIVLIKILLALTRAFPLVGYCQGMNYVVASVFYAILVETYEFDDDSRISDNGQPSPFLGGSRPARIQRIESAFADQNFHNASLQQEWITNAERWTFVILYALLCDPTSQQIQSETQKTILDTHGTKEGTPEEMIGSNLFDLANIWRPGVPKLKLRVWQMDTLIRKRLPRLRSHFRQLNLAPDFFVSQWFLTLFSYNLPFLSLWRLYDVFFVTHGASLNTKRPLDSNNKQRSLDSNKQNENKKHKNQEKNNETSKKNKTNFTMESKVQEQEDNFIPSIYKSSNEPTTVASSPWLAIFRLGLVMLQHMETDLLGLDLSGISRFIAGKREERLDTNFAKAASKEVFPPCSDEKNCATEEDSFLIRRALRGLRGVLLNGIDDTWYVVYLYDSVFLLLIDFEACFVNVHLILLYPSLLPFPSSLASHLLPFPFSYFSYTWFHVSILILTRLITNRLRDSEEDYRVQILHRELNSAKKNNFEQCKGSLFSSQYSASSTDFNGIEGFEKLAARAMLDVYYQLRQLEGPLADDCRALRGKIERTDKILKTSFQNGMVIHEQKKKVKSARTVYNKWKKDYDLEKMRLEALLSYLTMLDEKAKTGTGDRASGVTNANTSALRRNSKTKKQQQSFMEQAQATRLNIDSLTRKVQHAKTDVNQEMRRLSIMQMEYDELRTQKDEYSRTLTLTLAANEKRQRQRLTSVFEELNLS
eukprot:g1595.t1